MNNKLIIALIAAITVFAITCSSPGASENSSWTGSGKIVAPGYGNHEYTVYDVDFSHLDPGDRIILTVITGEGGCDASIELFPEGANIVETGRPLDGLCNIYDQRAGTERSVICTIKEPGVHKLCIEGNWFSEKGSTNTFRYLIEKIDRTAVQTYEVPPVTGDGWETADISSVGLDADLLLMMLYKIKENVYPNIHSVLIVKDDKLVMEEYFGGKNSAGAIIDFDKDTLHELHSVTKSFNSALIGIAIDQKLIPGVDTKIKDLFPQYTDILSDKLKDGIKLKHMLTMTTGIKWDESTYP